MSDSTRRHNTSMATTSLLDRLTMAATEASKLLACCQSEHKIAARGKREHSCDGWSDRFPVCLPSPISLEKNPVRLTARRS